MRVGRDLYPVLQVHKRQQENQAGFSHRLELIRTHNKQMDCRQKNPIEVIILIEICPCVVQDFLVAPNHRSARRRTARNGEGWRSWGTCWGVEGRMNV